MTRKAICSLGVGRHAALLDLSQPGLEHYASVHGYDLHIHRRSLQHERPPSWDKVPALQALLHDYDTVVWIDADAIITRFDRDIVEDAPPDRFCWMVRHRSDGDDVPDAGVLVLHRGRQADEFLELVWNSRHTIEHPWGERAAVLGILGYDTSDFVHARRSGATLWAERVGWLGNEWNSVSKDPHPDPRVRRYPGIPDRERFAAMTADCRRTAASWDRAIPNPLGDPDDRLCVVLPIRGRSPETAFAGLDTLARSDMDFQLVMVDDGVALDGVTSAVSGPGVQLLQHHQPLGLAASWDLALSRTTAEVVVLLTGPALLHQSCLRALVSNLRSDIGATTSTASADATSVAGRATALAARRRDLEAVGMPLGAEDGDALSELCLRLASGAGPIRAVATAVAEGPLETPSPELPQDRLPGWVLGLARASYGATLDNVPCREELPRVLAARGLSGTGVVVGVTDGSFPHHLLTYWKGRVIAVDADRSEDVQQAAVRLVLFGDRAELWQVSSQEAAAQLAPGTVDFVYFDRRADVAEVEAWLPALGRGAIVSGRACDGYVLDTLGFLGYGRARTFGIDPSGSWALELQPASAALVD